MRSEARGAPQIHGFSPIFPPPGSLPLPQRCVGRAVGVTAGRTGCWGWHTVAQGLSPAPQVAQAALSPRTACRAHTSHAAHAVLPTPVPPRRPAPHALPTLSLTPQESKSRSPSPGDSCPSTQSPNQPREQRCSPRSPGVAGCPWHGCHTRPLRCPVVPVASLAQASPALLINPHLPAKNPCAPLQSTLILHKPGSQGWLQSDAGVEALV